MLLIFIYINVSTKFNKIGGKNINSKICKICLMKNQFVGSKLTPIEKFPTQTHIKFQICLLQ